MRIILKPIVTEKMSKQGDELNRFGFIVNRKANKIQIKNAIEGMYSVNVSSVNTMVYPRKLKQRYTKTGLIKGKTSSFKKAIVTLAEGETIDFYSNI